MLASSIATDGHGRPTSAADGTTAAWNADGELTSLSAPDGASTFAYDGFGRLSRVTLPDGRVGRYRYDALGRRTALTIDGQLARRFVYGAALYPQARVDGAGDVLERYIYASYGHVPDLIVRRDGERIRLITDTLGSVRAAIDADTGTVLQRLSYDAYGRVTQNTSPGLQPFGYKGAISDPVAEGAGLVWMGVRAYTPRLARFTTPDPVGLAAGWNEHDALAGDPINLIDADGMFFSRNEIADASAGAGDALLSTFCAFQCNPGSWLRDQLDIDDNVDECSPAYNGGKTAAELAVPLPGPGKLKGLGKAAGAVEDGGRAAKKGQSAGRGPRGPRGSDDGGTVAPAESPVWNGLERRRGGERVDAEGNRHVYDRAHGEVEVFDPRGRHIGAKDPITGDMIKGPNRKKRLDKR